MTDDWLISRVANSVCFDRHPLEWLAPTPRRSACLECVELTRLVVSVEQTLNQAVTH